MAEPLAELVAEVIDLIPRATLRRRVMASAKPGPRQGWSGACPKCGRTLPRFSVISTGVASGFNAMAMPRTEEELVYECLVDGRRAKHARTYPEVALTAAANQLADGLQSAGWRDWAQLISEEGDAAAPRFERMFQGVEVVRRFGPVRRNDALELLVVSSGRYWIVWQHNGE